MQVVGATFDRHMGVTGGAQAVARSPSTASGRHDVDDQPMVAAAHLAFNLVLPTEAIGSKHLLLPDREITWIRKLYEKGIAGFYFSYFPEKDARRRGQNDWLADWKQKSRHRQDPPLDAPHRHHPRPLERGTPYRHRHQVQLRGDTWLVSGQKHSEVDMSIRFTLAVPGRQRRPLAEKASDCSFTSVGDMINKGRFDPEP